MGERPPGIEGGTDSDHPSRTFRDEEPGDAPGIRACALPIARFEVSGAKVGEEVGAVHGRQLYDPDWGTRTFLPHPFAERAVANPLAGRAGVAFGHEPARPDLPGGDAATAPDPPALSGSGVYRVAAEPHFLDQPGPDIAHDREGLEQVSMQYSRRLSAFVG